MSVRSISIRISYMLQISRSSDSNVTDLIRYLSNDNENESHHKIGILLDEETKKENLLMAEFIQINMLNGLNQFQKNYTEF